MALRNIVKDGDPSLLKKSREVVKFDDRLAILIDDMVETMHHADGVGLAAVQVGVLRRVIVIDVEDELLELVNPEIIYESEETECAAEGCLSFPDQQAIVQRPSEVTVTAKDRNGETVEYTGDGYLARAFCHEIDHLNGIVFLEKALSDEEMEEYLAEIEALEAAAIAEADAAGEEFESAE